MVRDTTPRRSRLIGTAFVLVTSACGAGGQPIPRSLPPTDTNLVSLGHLADAWQSGYPEQYPWPEVHAGKAQDILADDPAMAPMRPAPPLPLPEGGKEFRRRYLPEPAKPPPEPPAPRVTPPLAEPVLDTTPVSPQQAQELETESIESAEKPVLRPKLAR